MSAANLPDAGISPPGPNFMLMTTGDEHRPLAIPIEQISREIKSKHISETKLYEESLKEPLQPINNPLKNFDVVLFLASILLLKTTIFMQKLGARIADAQRLLTMTEEAIKKRNKRLLEPLRKLLQRQLPDGTPFTIDLTEITQHLKPFKQLSL